MTAAQQSLILVPGLLCTRELFAPQIAALSDVARIEVADHGRHASMTEIAAEILASAPERFAIAGLSMGGFVALEVVRQAPQRVSRLALLDTSARADRPEQKAQWESQIALARDKGPLAVSEALFPFMLAPSRRSDDGLRATIRRMAEATGAQACIRQQQAIMARQDYRPLLPSIRCPTLVLAGSEDKMTPPKLAAEMAEAIAGARLEVIDGAGHLPTLETPDAVSAAMRAWLAA